MFMYISPYHQRHVVVIIYLPPHRTIPPTWRYDLHFLYVQTSPPTLLPSFIYLRVVLSTSHYFHIFSPLFTVPPTSRSYFFFLPPLLTTNVTLVSLRFHLHTLTTNVTPFPSFVYSRAVRMNNVTLFPYLFTPFYRTTYVTLILSFFYLSVLYYQR